MANTKISNLTGAASVTDNSVFPVVDSGSTKKVTGTQIKTYARSGLSTVATSGSYTDLTNKPTIFDGNYNNLTNKPTLFDGSYTSLTSKPTLFDGNYNSLTNKPTLFDGSYNSLTDTPTIFDGNYDGLTNKPVISDTTGLTGGTFFIAKDSTTIQLGQWAAQAITIGTSGIQIAGTGGVEIAGVAGAGITLGGETSGTITFDSSTSGINYNDLTNKPTIPADISDLTDTNSLLSQGGGSPGQGVPTGGTTGQVLTKIDGTDYNTEWTSLASSTSVTVAVTLTKTVVNGQNVLNWDFNVTEGNATVRAGLGGAYGLPGAVNGDVYLFFTLTDFTRLPSTALTSWVNLNSTSRNLNPANVINFSSPNAITNFDPSTHQFWFDTGGANPTAGTYYFTFREQGPSGSDGSNGQGVAAGGTAGQVLTKIDGTDYNTQWVDVTNSASTGNITFADTTMTSTNGDINISFEPTASPAVGFSFTQTGTFIAASILTGTVEVGNSVRLGQTKMFATNSSECLPNVDTVIYTGSDALTSTIKALFHVEGAEDGSSGYDAQSCEMMIAQMNNRVAGSVYGLAYTSNAPLATFSTRVNSTTNLIEILCRPASTTSSVYVATTATEMFTTP